MSRSDLRGRESKTGMSQISPSHTRVVSIQVLRGVAALMVIFYHLRFSEQLMSTPEKCVLSPLLIMGAAGVDLFFVISGFIMVTVTQKKFGAKGAVRAFLYSRFSRVYPIYWLFTLAILTLSLLKPSLLNVPVDSAWNIIQSFLLFPQAQFPILKVGWTLVHEIYFYLVFALFLFLPVRWLTKALALWALFLLLGSAAVWSTPPPSAGLLDVVVNPLTFEFILGCLIALTLQKSSPLSGWIPLVLGLALLCVAAAFVSHLNMSFLSNIRENWIRLAACGMPAALIVYGAVALEKKGKVFLPWFQSLGDASYSLYLVHLFVLSAMVKLWSFNPWHGTMTKILWLSAMVALAVVSGLLIPPFVENPLLTWTHAVKTRFLGPKTLTS